MTRHGAPVAVVALVGVLLVTGCSVRVVDADASAGPVTGGDRTSGDAGDPGPDPTSAPPSAPTATPLADAPTADGDPGADGLLLDRTALRVDVTRSGPCGTDAMVVEAGAGVELTGDCGTLTVAGAATRVVAGHVDHLVVQGAGAHVVVASADRITLDAASVRVAWEGGEPQVTGSGADAAYGAVGTVHLDADD